MSTPVARITGLGVAVPDHVVTNADLERTLDTSDAWIAERTGIRERRIARPDQTLASLCAAAATVAMEKAGVRADEIDAIILATTTPDHPMPATACEVQPLIGAFNAVAFDIMAACAGFIAGLTTAEGLIATGRYRKVLVIGGEKLSRVTNWTDRGTAILFADGAGAVIVEPAIGDGRGILSTFMRTDGRHVPLLLIPAGGNVEPVTQAAVDAGRTCMHMAGREVFKLAVHGMSAACDEALRRAGLTGGDVDWLVPHQANLRIIDATAKHAGLPMERVVVNVDRYGNTSSASIPIAINEAVCDGRIRPGSLLLLAAFGAGLTSGSAVVRW